MSGEEVSRIFLQQIQTILSDSLKAEGDQERNEQRLQRRAELIDSFSQAVSGCELAAESLANSLVKNEFEGGGALTKSMLERRPELIGNMSGGRIGFPYGHDTVTVDGIGTCTLCRLEVKGGEKYINGRVGITHSICARTYTRIAGTSNQHNTYDGLIK